MKLFKKSQKALNERSYIKDYQQKSKEIFLK